MVEMPDYDPPCTTCADTGITLQTERPCACAAGDQYRAPQFDASRNVTDEEIEQWAATRADDAGYLARRLVSLKSGGAGPIGGE